MIINLFSYNSETTTTNDLFAFNQVVAWSLREAFTKVGIETRFVQDGQFWEEEIPEADHSIVISGFVMKTMRNNSAFYQKVRQATRGKVTVYLDADYSGWWKFFDHVFTIVKPTRSQAQYVYAGWGADPNIFYPDQDDKAVFIDSLMYGKYDGEFDGIYDDIKDVFHISEEQLYSKNQVIYETTVDGITVTVYIPMPTYRAFRVPWPDFGPIQRKCHFYICTQLGEGGLTRIESATCGALLVVPKPLFRPKTMAPLEHVVYETKQELIEILKAETNTEKIRGKALEHSWDRVVTRMLPYFGR